MSPGLGGRMLLALNSQALAGLLSPGKEPISPLF